MADDAFVQSLNKSFRGKDKPTNVLSFPACADPRSPIPDPSLGDIILAFETIAREAQDQAKSFKDHAVHLLVHGTLHLLGHDHKKDAQARDMEKLEINILKKLNINNPYL